MSGDSCSKILSALVSVLTLALIAVASVFIYREMRAGGNNSTQIIGYNNKTKLESTNIRIFYPGYFRNDDEQKSYEGVFYNRWYSGRRQLVETTVPNDNRNCSIQCLRTAARRKRQISTIEHGCCISRVVFESPNFLQNLNGQTRRLVWFDNARQFFPVHICNSILGCTGCTCSQETNIFVAVVWKDDDDDEPEDLEDTELDLFEFDGCCKCINF